MESKSIFFRVALAFSFAFHATAFCSPSFADERQWPDRPIHIIVPLPAGSAADTVARLIGSKLSAKLGQPVIINDQAGASGELATTQLARSDSDGNTLGLATTTTLVTAPILNPDIRYDALKDFVPVAMVGYSPYVLVVSPALGAKSVKDYIALAKSRAGSLSYSSVGEASLAHLAGELFANMAGVKLNEIPYKSSTQAIIDLFAGRIDSQFGILTTTHQYIKDGKLDALGVTTLSRVPEFADIPTISESGLPGFEASLWMAIVAPAKTPKEIVARLNSEINNALSQQDTRTSLFNQAIIADPRTPSELHDRIESDLRKWKDLAMKAGLLR
ncbi:MAG: tripartite tricarboxylate transporter substrate-binding protein [Xanthobacteraceae bacterium]|jgi:tripartite-type tricarboxylate transporter receptor subunit TctC